MTDNPTYKLIAELEKNGKLKELIVCGVCSPLVLRDLTVYRYIDARIRTGDNKMQAVVAAEVAFKVCNRTIFKILKKF